MKTVLRGMEQVSYDEWQIEKSMTTGSVLCSITFFLLSVARIILVLTSSAIEADSFSTGFSFEGNILLTLLTRNISLIIATFNMPIVLLLFTIQNQFFRENMKKHICSLMRFCQPNGSKADNMEPKNQEEKAEGDVAVDFKGKQFKKQSHSDLTRGFLSVYKFLNACSFLQKSSNFFSELFTLI